MKAIVDIGSNSCLLLIAKRNIDGSLQIERDVATVTRLSEGVAETGNLLPRAIERTLACLSSYKVIADSQNAPLEVVATEGVRMASNPDDFLAPAAKIIGQPVRLLSGDQEATLSYQSVALECPANQPLRVIDIGGGSTELVCGTGRKVDSAMSHRVGSVRFTEQFVKDNPPTLAQLQMVYDTAVEAFRQQPVAPMPILHGLAGTVTTLASLLLKLTSYKRELVDNSVFTHREIISLRDELAVETTGQREKRPTLSKGRADVIVTGITILLAVMDHCGAQQLVVRDRGLRYSLL